MLASERAPGDDAIAAERANFDVWHVDRLRDIERLRVDLARAEHLRAERAREVASLTQQLADTRVLHERVALGDRANRQLVIDLRAELSAREVDYQQQVRRLQQQVTDANAALQAAAARQRKLPTTVRELALYVWRAASAMLGRPPSW